MFGLPRCGDFYRPERPESLYTVRQIFLALFIARVRVPCQQLYARIPKFNFERVGSKLRMSQGPKGSAGFLLSARPGS